MANRDRKFITSNRFDLSKKDNTYVKTVINPNKPIPEKDLTNEQVGALNSLVNNKDSTNKQTPYKKGGKDTGSGSGSGSGKGGSSGGGSNYSPNTSSNSPYTMNQAQEIEQNILKGMGSDPAREAVRKKYNIKK